MLVDIFRDSVLRCFCHTCSVNSSIVAAKGVYAYQAPLSKKQKPRCRQPKKSLVIATEIRAEEKSRGGMSYEVILSPSKEGVQPPSPSSPTKELTKQDLDEKMERATLRRKTIEQEKAMTFQNRVAKLEEAAKKRQETNDNFITTTQASLDLKLDASTSNREAYLNSLTSKVAEHLAAVEQVRESSDEATSRLQTDIMERMKQAEENRDTHMKTMLEKLQAHIDCVARVRGSHKVAVELLDAKIRSKLEAAEAKREQERLRKLEGLRQHFEKIDIVQTAAEKKIEEKAEKTLENLKKKEEKVEETLAEKKAASDIKEKIEKAQAAKDLLIEQKRKETEDKIKQKEAAVEKNKQEIAEQAAKTKLEQERRAQQVRENKKAMGDSEPKCGE